MASRIWPFTMSLAHMIAMALLLVPFIVLTGVASAQNPVPMINQPLVPGAIAPGHPAFTLTVNGTGFASGAVVNWNGKPRATAFIGNSKLTASISATDIAKAGTASVTVVNPSPGGGRSNVAFFDVRVSSSAIALTASASIAGPAPDALAVGDFNQDGKLDLAVAMGTIIGNNVSILLGNGEGTFRPAINYSLGSGSPEPGAVAVGDFNGDGKLDLVLADSGNGNYSVLLGKGNGTFQSPITNTGGGGNSVVVGDFNGDGKLDLVFVPSSVNVLLGNGDGTFQPAGQYSAGTTPFSVAVGDFNRDGRLDLAIANFGSNNLSVLLGKGDGTFEPAVNYSAGSKPASVAVADFNHDGNLDLAVANLGSNNISILLGNGNGTFQPAVDYGAGSSPRMVATGDVNGDGKVDLLVANNAVNGGTGSVSVLLGNGNGTFRAAVDYVAGNEPEALAVGDFDGDGKLDVAVADYNSSNVFLLSSTAPFADQVVGTSSAMQLVMLTNYGMSALDIGRISIEGANSTDFAQNNDCGRLLNPGASCAIDVTFKPLQIGSQTATLSIADSASDGSQDVSLKGAGTVVSLSPASLDFGVILLGGLKNLATALTNTGKTTLDISKITESGSGFSQTNNCGSNLAPGASCTVTVTFKPPSCSLWIGTVWIYDNGGGSPQSVPLSGAGRCI